MATHKATAALKSQTTYTIPGKQKVTEYFFSLPLDHSKPWNPEDKDGGESITIFARGVSKAENPIVPPTAEEAKKKSETPWIVWLEGGPGNGSGPPSGYPWIPFLLEKGYQVLLLDQRGMGLSSTITTETLARRGDAKAQAEYLKLFRQDHSVKDCEAIRRCLTADWEGPEERRKWSTLGQSYGGFVTLSYLSFAPEGLRECFVAGGLSPVSQNDPDAVYQRCFQRSEARNRAYYAKFPADADRVKRIIKYLTEKDIHLPDGSIFVPERLMSLGLGFGMHGYFDTLHNILVRATSDLDQFGFLTRPTLSTIQSSTSFDDTIIYAILHEPIYCQGHMAPRWSAERVKSSLPNYNIMSSSPAPFFTPECVFSSTFISSSTLNPLHTGSPSVTNLLFDTPSDWTPLYDLAQLQKNTVPLYAMVYLNDMYVDFDFSMETARLTRNCITKVDGGNGWMHNAVREKTGEVMERLWMLRDEGEDGTPGVGVDGE